jgi:cell division septum initiation protein DivIVA
VKDVINASTAERNDGYEREMVDDYIRRLTEAYQIAYNEYQILSEKYVNLQNEYKKLEASIQIDDKSEAIARALVGAEILAGNIIKEAEDEASMAMATAKTQARAANEILQEAIKKITDLFNG